MVQVWVEVVVAATKSLVTAALLAPTILGAGQVQAETAPEKSVLTFKYLDYMDRQPGLDRVSVTAPAVNLTMPINGEWAIDAGHVVDSVSGASPRYHSEKLSATRFRDTRHGTDVKLIRYWSRGTVSVGTAYSTESDYESKVVSINTTFNSEDKNTTFLAGMAVANDRINPSNKVVINEHKQVRDLIIGVTQVVTQRDIVQANLTDTRGKGYYSDPYKFFDNRPRVKSANAFLTRWNHYFDSTDGTSRMSYRYYRDSYGVKSHTATGEYVQPLSNGWTITPHTRLYTQSAAFFYFDPVNPPDPTIPDNFVLGETFLTLDQRLSSYGGIALGIKVSKQITKDFAADFKYENYQQRSKWALNDNGSPGIDPFKAKILQVGFSYTF